jgi:hypothetical protein
MRTANAAFRFLDATNHAFQGLVSDAQEVGINTMRSPD